MPVNPGYEQNEKTRAVLAVNRAIGTAEESGSATINIDGNENPGFLPAVQLELIDQLGHTDQLGTDGMQFQSEEVRKNPDLTWSFNVTQDGAKVFEIKKAA